jgi:hypothetical protein
MQYGDKYTAEAMAASLRENGIKSGYLHYVEDLVSDIREYMKIAERKKGDANPKEDRLCPLALLPLRGLAVTRLR